MDLLIAAKFSLGLVLLVAGAEMLVRGASRLAARLGVSPLVIGLTVVAFGTGSPELAVSVQSALSGQPDIALGNVVGSNILNVLLVLGLSAMVAPLIVATKLVRLDVPLMVAASLLLYAFSRDGSLQRVDGAVLLTGIVVYTGWSIWEGRRAERATRAAARGPEASSSQPDAWPLPLAAVVAGLVMLTLGSRWLVTGAVSLAQLLGISELVIGLTVIALGTSLPEVATSVIATLRGERDIAIGNVIGSNLFNILGVAGSAALIAPHGIPVAPAALNFDLPVMIATAFACLPIFFSGNCVGRWEGLLFFGYYIAYTAYLVLKATEHDSLPAFSAIMIKFSLPITAATLVLLVLNALRRNRRRRP